MILFCEGNKNILSNVKKNASPTSLQGCKQAQVQRANKQAKQHKLDLAYENMPIEKDKKGA